MSMFVITFIHQRYRRTDIQHTTAIPHYARTCFAR